MGTRRRGKSRVRDSIEVRSPAVDAERLLKAVEANMAARRAGPWMGYIPSYDDLMDATADEGSPPRSEAEYYLQRLRFSDVSVTPDVRPSGVPVFGRLLDLLRRQLHNLVLYYVNILAAKQAHHNAQVFRMVTYLNRERRRLRAELDKMKAQDSRSLPGKHGEP